MHNVKFIMYIWLQKTKKCIPNKSMFATYILSCIALKIKFNSQITVTKFLNISSGTMDNFDLKIIIIIMINIYNLMQRHASQRKAILISLSEN